MARGGAKKRPFYRIVVAEGTSPRDGRFVERLGHYNPLLASDHPERVVLKTERAQYWLSQGAKPSERVESFLAKAGLVPAAQKTTRPQKSAPKKKAQERLKVEAEKAASLKAEAEKAAPSKVETPQSEAEAPAPLKEEAATEVPEPLDAETATEAPADAAQV